MLRRVWLCRWNLARLALALGVLWIVLEDAAPRLARLGLASLPDFNYAREVAALREQGLYGEAQTLAAAGLDHYAAADLGPPADALRAELDKVNEEQSSWLRRARDVGLGALTGQGRSLESLLGAIGSDLLVVGDVRDLLLQASRLLMDGEADPVIIALSGLGIALTAAPEIDWGASVLKIARKSGVMTRELAEQILAMARRGSKTELEGVAASVGTLAKTAGPGAATRALRRARSADELAELARFTSRHGRAGAAALHIGGDSTLAWLAKNGPESEALLLKASTKGPAGIAYAASPKRLPLLLRPHPLVGLTKGLYKGNLQAAVSRVIDALGAAAWWLLPLVGGWASVELWLLLRKLASSRATSSASPTPLQPRPSSASMG